jgi:hypothetical protein
MPDGGPQSADDKAVEVGELPARSFPTSGQRLTHPAGAGCRTAVRRVQMMELSKPASSSLAAAPYPAGAGCRTADHRVQMTELSKLASSPCAAAPHPAAAGCRTAACRVQMMELS